jgi:hypothetical protein
MAVTKKRVIRVHNAAGRKRARVSSGEARARREGFRDLSRHWAEAIAERSSASCKIDTLIWAILEGHSNDHALTWRYMDILARLTAPAAASRSVVEKWSKMHAWHDPTPTALVGRSHKTIMQGRDDENKAFPGINGQLTRSKAPK